MTIVRPPTDHERNRAAARGDGRWPVMPCPIAVPEHVTAALLDGEVALYDTDDGQWYATAGDGRDRPLGIAGAPVRPRHDMVDEMRHVYERGGLAP